MKNACQIQLLNRKGGSVTVFTNRFVGWFVMGLAICGTLLAAWNSKGSARLESRTYNQLMEKVQVNVRVNLATCPNYIYKLFGSRLYPLVVEVINNSERAIYYTKFHIEARRPNYSGSLTLKENHFATDRIIEPNERWVECKGIEDVFDDDMSKLIWKVRNVTLEFAEAE
jgi:hypothetical protein